MDFWVKILLIVYRPKRLRFGAWSKLEQRLAHSKSVQELAQQYIGIYFDYIHQVTRMPYWIIKRLRWQRVFMLFVACRETNNPRRIPIFNVDDKTDEVEWDYPGRKHYVWIHLLASQYGWTLDYIEGLDIDTVLSLGMETIVDNQLDREFVWSTTEVAYAYDKSTKQSKFQSLPRPKFMLPKPKPIKKVLMKAYTVPMGVVEDVGGLLDYVEKRIQTQAPNPQ